MKTSYNSKDRQKNYFYLIHSENSLWAAQCMFENDVELLKAVFRPFSFLSLHLLKTIYENL